MNKVFLAVALISGLAMGCDSTDTGNAGGTGGMPIIGPLNWNVSAYTVVGDDDCESASPTEPLTAFEITIDGNTATATLESLDLMVPGTGAPLGGIAMPYADTDDPVIFTASFMDSAESFPDCVVDATDTFTVDLDNPSVSLAENTTVQVTWNHAEIDGSTTAGACTNNWFVALPCESQSTFTLTQDPAPQ